MSPDRLMEALDLTGSDPVLLLMDYVERCDSWDNWLWALQDAHDAGRKVHLLGTCQTGWSRTLDSYQTRLEAFPEEMPETVVRILEQRSGLVDLAASCRGIPVFAAFLCMIHDAGQVHELSVLRREKDFERWLQQHLIRLPSSGSSASHAALVELLINLPCSDSALHAMETATPTMQMYRGQLVDDGWLIEDIAAPDSERWSTLHDILADGALLRWLSNTPLSQSQAQIQRWFISARRRGEARTLLRTLQRVGQEDGVRRLNWPAIFGGRISEEVSPQERDSILNAHLMPPIVAFEWIDNLPEGPEQALSSFVVQMTLGDAIKDARRAQDLDCILEAKLLKWADLAAKTLIGSGVPVPSEMPNRVLVQAIQWFPEKFRDYARQWLKVFHRQEQAQFLLNAWLDLKLPGFSHRDIQVWCANWLRRYECRPVASFVFRHWLKAGGAKALVEESIQRWLAEPGQSTTQAAPFVVTAWLDAGGDKELVEEAIKQWLAVPCQAISQSTPYVVTAWLNAGGDKALVEESIKLWLAAPGRATSQSAPFVIRAWLAAGGGKLLVEEPIRRWLAVPGQSSTQSAQFVLTAWLNASGDKELVESSIKLLLEDAERATSSGAQFVFTAWLNAGGYTELVQESIQRWLEAPGQAVSPSAQFVYKAWLAAGGDKALVEEPIHRWLLEPGNATSWDAQFVFKAWLDAGGTTGLVEEPIQRWLAESGRKTCPEAQFVFTAWMNAEGEVEVIESAIQSWLALPDNRILLEVGFLIRALGDRLGRLPEWALDLASDWIVKWKCHPAAIYPLKYISGLPSLSGDGVNSVILCCLKNGNNSEAITRLSKVGHVELAQFNNRGLLVNGAGGLIISAIGQQPVDYYKALSSLLVISLMWRLPIRSSQERKSFDELAVVACKLLKKIDPTIQPRANEMPEYRRNMLSGTDWERIVQIGLSKGEEWDENLRQGIRLISTSLRSWACTHEILRMYDRLLSQADRSIPVPFPRPL